MNDIQQIAASVDSLKDNFETHRYICSDQIATAVYLAFHLKKPVLIEGPPGVGKTELAKTTADMFALPLIRLQCYEGLDEAKALYEWKYGKQLPPLDSTESGLMIGIGTGGNDASRFIDRPLLH